jgi:hypothetical protein
MKISEVYQAVPDEEDFTPMDLLTERIADLRGVVFMPVGESGVLAIAVDVLVDTKKGAEVDVSKMESDDIAEALKTNRLIFPPYWRQAMVMRLSPGRTH